MPTPTKSRIILAGGTGFLGTSLVPALIANGYSPVVLTRTPPIAGTQRVPGPVEYVRWDAKTSGPWATHLNHAHAIVNLVGRSVDCRKTPANKRAILHSRLDSVRALADACQQVPHPPPIWLQSSTAHIYGDTADEPLTESSPPGTGFAPDVGRAWEQALTTAPLPNCRKVFLRISFVLGRNGGALKTLARLARLGLGGTVGTGRQYMSWLHIADLNAILLRALSTPTMTGVYNCTAPYPVPNADFMRQLRRAIRRPWSPPTPAPLVRLGSLLMRTDPELALLGRRVLPTRLLAEGFSFQFPTLPEALHDLLP